jgi:ABC-type multidrug transport system fused ATPase/permease subunit
MKLADGQRQRLAIARVILKNPQILIFDEATSAIDAESEGLIREALRSVMKDRTTIIISHRFTMIHEVDKIVVLQEGRIVGEGTHGELYWGCPIYRRLYDSQFGLHLNSRIEIPLLKKHPVREESVNDFPTMP